MPYIIHGPVPTQALGKCPWCETPNAILHLLATKIDGILGGEYVCAWCLYELDQMKLENDKRNGKKILYPNPEVEIDEDE